MKIYYDENTDSLQPTVIVLEHPRERALLAEWVQSLKKRYDDWRRWNRKKSHLATKR